MLSRSILCSILPLSITVGCPVAAQPIIASGQYTCLPGDVFTFIALGPESPGQGGPDQIWSYSSLPWNTPQDQTYVDPATSAGAIHFPTATVLHEATGSGGGTFFSASDIEVVNLGYFASIGGDVLGLCTDPATVITYPFAYGSTFTDDYVCSETGGGFSDRVRTGVITVTADGYGTLVLPYGTFNDCLRLHMVPTYTDVYEQTSVNGYGEVDTYAFVQPGIRVPLFSTGSSSYVQGDQTFGGSVSNLLDPISTGVLAARSEVAAPFTYPNPAGDNAQVTLPSMQGTLDLLDGMGRMMRAIPLSGRSSVITLHTDELAPGSYLLRWTGADGARGTSRLVRQ